MGSRAYLLIGSTRSLIQCDGKRGVLTNFHQPSPPNAQHCSTYYDFNSTVLLKRIRDLYSQGASLSIDILGCSLISIIWGRAVLIAGRSNGSYDLLSVIQSVLAMPFSTVNPKKLTTTTEQTTRTCDTDIIMQSSYNDLQYLYDQYAMVPVIQTSTRLQREH